MCPPLSYPGYFYPTQSAQQATFLSKKLDLITAEEVREESVHTACSRNTSLEEWGQSQSKNT